MADRKQLIGQRSPSRGRRPTVAAEAARRTRERRIRLGGRIRASRLRRGWTQALLAARCGVGRQIIGRAERGDGRLDLETLERVALALDVPLILDLGRDMTEDVQDAGHLGMQELILRLGRASGFAAAFELTTRPQDSRQSIDVVLADDRRCIAIVIECWNRFGDIGAAARSTARKVAELAEIASHRWGGEARVSSVWIVRDTARNRQLVARYPEVFQSRFPGSSRRWVDALTNGAEPPSEPGLVWCDVGATRLYEWRRR